MGNTPLHLTSIAGRAKAAGLLIERGADVNARNASGQTPLHYSLMTREEFEYLHKGGDAARNFLTGKMLVGVGKVVYRRAVFARNELSPVSEMLLRHGADVDARGHDMWGETPLHIAMRNYVEVRKRSWDETINSETIQSFRAA